MPLDSNARIALRAIYSRGMIRGRDMKRLTNLPTDAVRQALISLAQEKFITISGDAALNSDQSALDAYIAPLPSKEAEGNYELNILDP